MKSCFPQEAASSMLFHTPLFDFQLPSYFYNYDACVNHGYEMIPLTISTSIENSVT